MEKWIPVFTGMTINNPPPCQGELEGVGKTLITLTPHPSREREPVLFPSLGGVAHRAGVVFFSSE